MEFVVVMKDTDPYLIFLLVCIFVASVMHAVIMFCPAALQSRCVVKIHEGQIDAKYKKIPSS